ncbi:N-carbamoyl-L-amino acid hydrolase [bioreactor metagenome]|uniref:N-carbamoyl-L-amino acid hydrolase n=1 Tax=bioreactor metagenome TaxID=1076179 RepID=A0A645E0D6_9ZZZZ
MPSGAAHDAMIMAELCSMGMIFVRSRDGLSHCPEEFSSKEDIGLGAELLLHSIIKVANGFVDEE